MARNGDFMPVQTTNPEVLEKLNTFLSTDMRRDIFLFYVFLKAAPSDLSEVTKIPISTVDMITNTLRLMELLRPVKGKNRHKNYYTVNMDTWLDANLRIISFDFIKVEQRQQILDILNDRKFLAISYILSDPDLSMQLYEEPLKMGDDIIAFKIMQVFNSKSSIPNFPSYLMMSVLVFPMYRQLKENLFSGELLKDTVALIKERSEQYPWVDPVLRSMDDATLKDFNRKRTLLANLMERLIEENLQLLSSAQTASSIKAEAEEKTIKSELEPTLNEGTQENASEEDDTKISDEDIAELGGGGEDGKKPKKAKAAKDKPKGKE